MQQKVIDYLQQLDLSETEAQIYLCLLRTGPLTVRDLARTVGIKRTSAYMHIDRLLDRGLIVENIKGSRKFITANDPEKSIENILKERQERTKKIEKDLPQVIQDIKQSIPPIKPIEDAEIKYYRGIHAVRKIYEEAFKGKEIRSYVKVEEAPRLSSNNPNYFSDAFTKNKNLKMWELIYESPISRRQTIKLLSKKHLGYFSKFMPPNLKWSNTSEDILIYDGKVAIINYRGKVSSIILQSSDFYNNFKEIFDFVWQMIPNEELENEQEKPSSKTTRN